jgi:hypothetical protein
MVDFTEKKVKNKSARPGDVDAKLLFNVGHTLRQTLLVYKLLSQKDSKTTKCQLSSFLSSAPQQQGG